jgi:hypothetical protein
MKASELRIGNWVKDRYDLTQPILIESIGTKGINIYPDDDGKPYGMHSARIENEFLFSEIQPIILTEEWLLKFGFWKRDGGNTWNNPVGNYRYAIHQTSMLYPFDVRSTDPHVYFIDTVKHVHSLQNLIFALTEEELQIQP